jgi:hypothetical protein
MIDLLLEEFDFTLKKHNKIAYEKLEQPLPKSVILNTLKEFGLAQDKDLNKLYNWKSGTKVECKFHMMKFGNLLNFSEVKELVAYNSDYDPALIPIIGEGDAYLLFNSKKGQHYGKLYLFCPSLLYIQYPISCFDSISTMLETNINAYRQNIYTCDIDGTLIYDLDLFSDLARKYNKVSTFWRDHDAIRPEEWYQI